MDKENSAIRHYNRLTKFHEENIMKKSSLLGIVCTCIFPISANAAVVQFDTTEIVFSASGSANTIGGGWSANSMVIPAEADILFFALEVKELSVTDCNPIYSPCTLDNPNSISFTSVNFPGTLNNAGVGLSLCWNTISCVTTVDVGSTATISSSSEWTFLARLIENYDTPFTTSGPTSMSWTSGGFDVSANGVLSVAAYGESVVPIPSTIWLFGSGLLGLIGMARRKKAA